MQSLRTLTCVLLIAGFSVDGAFAQKKRKKKKEQEEITQVLETPKDPPAAISVDPARLTFLSAPMSTKGLLSQQVRDGLKALRSLAKGAQIVKVRAFVAGTGDLRRVPAIVSDVYDDSKQPIPAVSAIQVGALPIEGAQVWMEGIAVEKKPVNPNGLAFLSGQAVSAKEPLEKVAPLLQKSAGYLNVAFQGAQSSDMLRVTCFVSALGDYEENRRHLAEQFPKAALTIVQLLRGLSNGLVECEGVARLTAAPSTPVALLNPAGLTASPNYSQVALVHAPKIILTATQLAFHARDEDVRLAFDRLGKTLEQSGSALKNTAFASFYPLAQSTTDKIRRIRFDYFDKAKPPGSTMLLFEGLPSLDASFAVEVVALP